MNIKDKNKAPKLCHCCMQDTYINLLELARECHYPMINSSFTKYVEHLRENKIDVKRATFWRQFLDVLLVHTARAQIDLKDTYVCSNADCGHIYRNFYEQDAAEFHRNDYRKKDTLGISDKKPDTLDLGTKDDIHNRFVKANTVIGLGLHFFNQSESVLEIAPGKGFLHRALLEHEIFKKIDGVTIDKKVVQHNKVYNPESKIFLSDVLEFKTKKKYDIVLAMDVLEHIEDVSRFVLKMKELTKKYVVVQVPIERRLIPPNYNLLTDEEKLPHHSEFDGHLHYFTRESLSTAFTKNGDFKLALAYRTYADEVAGGKELFTVWEKV